MTVWLLSTRAAYRQLMASSAWPPAALWVLPDVLRHTEIERLRAAGLEVSCFTQAFDMRDGAALANAIDIIREHHPEQAVWVDGVAVD